jgi:hypothetical protein
MMPSLTPHSCQHVDMAILPNMSSRTVTVITSHRCTSAQCSRTGGCLVHYTRFSHGGKILGDGTFGLPDIGGTEILRVLPVDRCGGYALEVNVVHSEIFNDYQTVRQEGRNLYFDEKANTFKDPKYPVSQSSSIYTVPREVMWWKDTFYQISPGREFFYKGHTTTDVISIEALLAYMGTRYVGICVCVNHQGHCTNAR